MNNELVQYIENEIFPLYNRNEEEQIERVYQHLIEKYGENGYAKVYLEDKEFEDALDKLRQAVSNKEEFIKRVKKVVKTI